MLITKKREKDLGLYYTIDSGVTIRYKSLTAGSSACQGFSDAYASVKQLR